MEALKERYQNTGWNYHGISKITTIPDRNSTDPKLFKNYGKLSATEINTHATTYTNKVTRHKHNNNQIYHCLKNSLNIPGTAKIITESTKYHI